MGNKSAPVILYSGVPKSLDDIRINPAKLGELRRDFDPNIENLVKAVNFFGVKTLYSCEGHMRKDRLHYPWIDLASDPESMRNMEKLRKAIIEFNGTQERGWGWQVGTEFHKLVPLGEAANQDGLRQLQHTGEELAKFLFQKRLEVLKDVKRR